MKKKSLKAAKWMISFCLIVLLLHLVVRQTEMLVATIGSFVFFSLFFFTTRVCCPAMETKQTKHNDKEGYNDDDDDGSDGGNDEDGEINNEWNIFFRITLLTFIIFVPGSFACVETKSPLLKRCVTVVFLLVSSISSNLNMNSLFMNQENEILLILI